MTLYNRFNSNVHPAGHPVTEGQSGWKGYEEWSRELEARGEGENLYVLAGKVHQKPEPRSLGRTGGFEL
jgi:hypothetical protein